MWVDPARDGKRISEGGTGSALPIPCCKDDDDDDDDDDNLNYNNNGFFVSLLILHFEINIWFNFIEKIRCCATLQ